MFFRKDINGKVTGLASINDVYYTQLNLTFIRDGILTVEKYHPSYGKIGSKAYRNYCNLNEANNPKDHDNYEITVLTEMLLVA